MVVEEVRDIGVVSAPAEQEQPCQRTGVGVTDERTRHLLVKRDADVDRSQLRLEVRRDVDRERQVAAGHVAIGQSRVDAGAASGVVDHLLCRLDVRVRPIVACAGECDRARGEVGRDL